MCNIYLTSLLQELRFRFVIKLVAYALKTDEADARLVSNLFVQAASNGQCAPYVFEKGFMPMAGRLDKYAFNFLKAYYYMAMMLKGAGFENEPERLKRIVSELEDSNKLCLAPVSSLASVRCGLMSLLCFFLIVFPISEWSLLRIFFFT